jgi:hypothetical protein
MPDQAHVTSSEAIEFFRAALITYATKSRPLLEDACDEVLRTREWLETDRRLHWENQVRRRTRALEEAQQALFSAKLSNLRDARASETMAVERAKRALAEAQEKLRRVKRWVMEFDQRAQVLVKELEHVRWLIANEMPMAAAHLAQIVHRVEAYAGVAKPSASVSGPAPEPGAAPEKEQS